jgi:putative ABC transport system permease protein
VESLGRDFRFAVRTLIKNPGFTAVSILSLGLGIGAVSSVYTMVSSIFLTPLPFEESDRLVTVFATSMKGQIDSDAIRYPEFLEWEKQSTSFDSMAVFSNAAFNFSGGNEPDRLIAALVSDTYFKVLRVKPEIGRVFAPEDEEKGAPRTAVLSHGLWQRRFNGAPNVVGKTISLDGNPFEVIGVMPENFVFLSASGVEAWLTIPQNSPWADRWDSAWLNAIGRLKPGIAREAAQAELDTVANRLAQERPDAQTGRGTRITDINEAIYLTVSRQSVILFAAAAFVLLIACVNVANLLLARAASRQKEIAVRYSVGAGRVQIIRQLTIESLVLAAAGGALGILFALWGIDLIVSLLPKEEAQTYVEYFQFGMNGNVLAFTAVVTLLTGVLFGLFPAIQTSSLGLADCLKEGAMATGVSGRRHRFLKSLVVAEVALALMLLIGATLMGQSYAKIVSADLGFNNQNLLTTAITLTKAEHPENTSVVSFFRDIEERLRRISGVVEVGAANGVPFRGGNSGTHVTIEGAPELPPGQFNRVRVCSMTPGYLHTLKVPVVKGRELTWEDNNADTPVALINESFANKFWPNQDPTGKRFMRGGRWHTVAGVVQNYSTGAILGIPEPMFFESFPQAVQRELAIVIRTTGPPDDLAMSVRKAVRELDSDQPLARMMTMDELIFTQMWFDRFTTILFGLFAGLALTLAVIGVYGVINNSVVQRTHEIGVRMALGARPANVRAMILKQGLVMAGVGVIIGIAGAWAVMRYMQGLLYGVSASDPVTFVAGAIFLLAVAAVASYIPAVRATRIPPTIALRYE